MGKNNFTTLNLKTTGPESFEGYRIARNGPYTTNEVDLEEALLLAVLDRMPIFPSGDFETKVIMSAGDRDAATPATGHKIPKIIKTSYDGLNTLQIWALGQALLRTEQYADQHGIALTHRIGKMLVDLAASGLPTK